MASTDDGRRFPAPRPRRRIAATGLAATVLLGAAGCTDDEPRADPVETIPAAEPVGFGEEPLWSMEETPGSAPDGARAGLEEIYNLRLVGDYLVLIGYDEDGDLDHGEGDGHGEGALVVLDARTGERIWWRQQRSPLPEDELMTVSGFGNGGVIHPMEVDGQAALAVAYEKYSNDFNDATDTEVGVAALSLATGDLLASVRVRDGSLHLLDPYIRGSEGEEVLLHIVDREADTSEAMLVDFAAGEVAWSREDFAAVAMVGDTVLLEDPFQYLGESALDVALTSVDRRTGETLWGPVPNEFGTVTAEAYTDDFILASTVQGGGMLDIATGEWSAIPELDSGVYSGCATDGATLLACATPNRDLVAIPLDESFDRIVELTGTKDAEPAAVMSGWVFATAPGEDEDAYFAIDAAGNRIETPGVLGGFNDEIAVFHTGPVTYDLGTISAYTIDR